jgi:hypothetical protein
MAAFMGCTRIVSVRAFSTSEIHRLEPGDRPPRAVEKLQSVALDAPLPNRVERFLEVRLQRVQRGRQAIRVVAPGAKRIVSPSTEQPPESWLQPTVAE